MSDAKLRDALGEFVGQAFPEMVVQVGHSRRWNRRVLTFRWEGFKGLLPEARFHRLTRQIPAEFRETHLAGCVWFELDGSETPDDYLKLHRSEDVLDRVTQVLDRLDESGFFARLAAALGPGPKESCAGEFRLTRAILDSLEFRAEAAREALLVLMSRGAFCDCEALRAAHVDCFEASRP